MAPGKATRFDPLEHLTFPEFAEAERTETLWHYAKPPRYCHECKRTDPIGLRVHVLNGLRCSLCAPRVRTCRRCNKEKPLREFAVRQRKSTGPYVDVYCAPCVRERSRQQYHEAKKKPRADRVKYRVCSTCGIKKPAEDFPPDERYVGAIMHECYKCRG